MAEVFTSSFKNELTIIYILHFILEIIIIVFDIHHYISKYWINISFKIIFLVGIIILYFFCIYTIIPLYYIYCCKNITKTFFNNNKKISFIFLILNILVGVTLNVFFWINLSKYPSFYKDCPYNFSLSDLVKLNDNNYKSNEICQKRLCFNYESKLIDDNNIDLKFDNSDILLNIEEEDNNSYLCNFDSSIEFENNEVLCKKVSITSKNNYLNFCNKYIFYYICQRNNNPLKYNININNECPMENRNSINFVDILIILNIIFGIIPWCLELIFIKKYLNKIGETQNQNGNNNQNIINVEQLQNENQIRNILNKTANSSNMNIHRPTSNENVNINGDINEVINESIQKNESKENMQFIFIGKESKNSVEDIKEDEKESIKDKEKLEINKDFEYNINSIQSMNKETETNNFDTKIINKIQTKEIVVKKKKVPNGNLFYLKKENNNNDENKAIINKKMNRFINSNNKSLNFFGPNILNRRLITILNDQNKSDYTNKKNTDILNKIENNCLSCKKEEKTENKDKTIHLTKTVKKSRKERNKIMDSVFKLLENHSNSKSELKSNNKLIKNLKQNGIK